LRTVGKYLKNRGNKGTITTNSKPIPGNDSRYFKPRYNPNPMYSSTSIYTENQLKLVCIIAPTG
jgi:hypothetical protein